MLNLRVRKELENILENLQEAIITLTEENNIGFCYKLGFLIIKDIQGTNANENSFLKKKVLKLHQNLRDNSQISKELSKKLKKYCNLKTFLKFQKMS